LVLTQLAIREGGVRLTGLARGIWCASIPLVQNKTPRVRLATLIAVASLGSLCEAGCGSDSPSRPDAAGLPDAAEPPEASPQTPDGGECNVLVESQPNGGHVHTQDCSPVTYVSNPPASGTHYPDWAMYKSYTAPVPWGFLVHDLEHGAVVITYSCPDGCADEVAQVQAFIGGLPPDAGCNRAPMKIVLAPAPDLDVRWAASAWTWTLRASCFDSGAFAAFITAHYQGPDTEAACGGGIDLSPVAWCQ